MTRAQTKAVYNPHPRSMFLQKIEPRSANQRTYWEAMQSHTLIFATGPAGTGKTWLAVANAAYALLSGRVERIIVSRPVLEAGERLGFLPGDIFEKTDPYLRPLYDALGDMIGYEETQRYIRQGLIEIAPLAFMRGRSLQDAAVILDEAQNCTRAQMKMFLTRLGQGSHFVVCGDRVQSDLPPNEPSGLNEALTLLASLNDVATIALDDKDIQRHGLVGDIVRAYENR